MAVRIRLRRMGSTKRPFYRIVVAEAKMPRDGRFIEIVGYYNPITEPAEIKVDEDKVYKWLRQGAQPTDTVRGLLRKTGVWRKWGLLKRGVDISQLEDITSISPSPAESEAISTGESDAAEVPKEEKESAVADAEAKPEVNTSKEEG